MQDKPPGDEQALDTGALDTLYATVEEARHGGSRPGDYDTGTLPSWGGDKGGTSVPRIGRFEFVRELGRGGMGRVVEARDRELRRAVAVKVMFEPAEKGSEAFKRFVNEARITARLEHPSIVPIHDLGTGEDGRAYFVMKKIEGRLLSRILDALDAAEEQVRHEWTRHRLLNTFAQICQAVAYAHDRGVLHRDLKPDNIMLGPFGEVLVMDWGVAGVLGDRAGGAPADRAEADTNASMTQDGFLVGTPGYMSPEQARGELQLLDGRSDVWSLGAILYEILTYRHAYTGVNAAAVLLASLSGPPMPAHARAPHLAVPGEIAEICTKALAPAREDRFQSAIELRRAVEAFLEGTRRREEAERRVVEAERRWLDYLLLVEAQTDLAAREKTLTDSEDAWAPISEKTELLGVRDELAALEPRRAALFADVLALSEKAFAHDPGNMDARAVLANAYWHRLREAEARRDATDAAYCVNRLAAYDDGRYSAMLDGTGAITLHTDPPGAEVICRRFERRGLVWPLGEERSLGQTPLEGIPLAMGSYVLTVLRPDRPEVILPVYITRGRHWTSGQEPIVLPSAADRRPGLAYVPAGELMAGGDREAPGSLPGSEPRVGGFFIAELPVTMEAYCEFLNVLHGRDPDEAWRRTPRSEGSLLESGGQYFKRPAAGERYQLPDLDWDGERGDPTWPVFGVSWNDARAYAAWASERDGVAYRLPTELEYEKAARGVDGRFYPWGDGFDRTLCKMGDSRRTRPRPEPVGAFPSDRSIYGVRDLAGSMRDWCDDEQFDGDASLRPVRGGSWNYDPRFCRAACRLGRPPWRVFAYNGFRLACGLPRSS